MAATPATVTTLDPILKVVYQDRATMIAYEDRPFLGLVKKIEKFGGKNYTVEVRYGAGTGRSIGFTNAQTNSAPNTYGAFVVTRVNDYAVGSINGDAMDAADSGDTDAAAEGLQGEIDGVFETISQSLSSSLFRSGTGTIGQISAGSNTATATITLAQPLDIVNFEKNMVLRVSATDGAGAGVRVGSVTVSAVDRDAGTITATGNWTAGIAAAVANDFISVDGDYDAKVKGLGAWIPATAALAASTLFGLDRTPDVVRLGGQRLSGNGAPFEETWQKAMSKGRINSARFDMGFMNPDDHYLLSVALGSKGILNMEEKKASDMPMIGYTGFKVAGASGSVSVVADRDCPKGTGYSLTMSTLHFRSIGKSPRLLNLDGLKILRSTSADSYEFRGGYRGNLVCNAPGKNMRITW